MPMMTIIDNPHATLWYHPETKIVHHRIHKFISGEPFRALLNTGANLIKKNQARKWLSDDRDNYVLAKEDLDWSRENWAPACARAGWKYWAIVQPEKVLAQVAMERLVKEYGKLGVTARFFNDPSDAMTCSARSTSTAGTPWTKEGFKASWQKAFAEPKQRERDLPAPWPLRPIKEAGLVFHGLRKSAVVFLLEAGCSHAEVSAITGQSHQMVEHYGRQVSQRKLAASAILKWERAGNESLQNTLQNRS